MGSRRAISAIIKRACHWPIPVLGAPSTRVYVERLVRKKLLFFRTCTAHSANDVLYISTLSASH